jgi:hydrogenase nickel incorporation protein HypA/HybF
MHELGLMQSVLDSANESAHQAGAVKVLEIHLSVGEMTEAVPDALDFAFEALSTDTLSEGAVLDINFIKPRSRCLACGHEYEHTRYHISCPACQSLATELIAGRELFIDSIEVDIPDDDEQS